MQNSYNSAIKILQSQGKFYINPELVRIEKILNLIGNPQNKINVIHVAGTNGKGSVCAIIANILKQAGYKTALYTSPHLKDYTERIQINNKPISKNDFAKYIKEICEIEEKNKINLTEFELLTAVAFKYFYDNKIDIAIIETGMGGRFDATNTVKNPLLEIITSISFDHIDRLGNTIEKIAYEKAGIIKQNSCVVISKDNNGYEIIKKIATEKNANVISENINIEIKYKNEQNIAIINGKSYNFALLGTYQKENLALVFQAINYLNKTKFKIDENAIINGLSTVKWKARLQYIKEKNLLIDGAHNPAAAAELKKSLDIYFKNQKKFFIYSTINTKDYIEISKLLFNPDDIIYYLDFHHKNAVSVEEFIKNVPYLKNVKSVKMQNITELLKEDNLKILTGSLYMIGEFFSAIDKI